MLNNSINNNDHNLEDTFVETQDLAVSGMQESLFWDLIMLSMEMNMQRYIVGDHLLLYLHVIVDEEGKCQYRE